MNARPTIAPAVKTLLATLRRRIRQYVWLEGCAAAATCLGAAFWATLAADWFFEPPPAVRGVMLAAVGAAMAVVLVRFIGRRAFVPISDSNAATVLERRFPELNDSLLTAVVLGNRDLNAADVNPEMLARTCREAADRIAGVDVRRVFDPRPLWRHGTAAAVFLLSAAIFAVLFPESFGVWARRALALSSESWPRTMRLSIDGFAGGVRKVARGADLEIVVRADMAMPRVPEAVEVRYRIDGSSRGRATMDRRGLAHRGDRFQEYTYTFRGIMADVRFDVLGGDARLRDLRIQAVDSPTISRMVLDCQLPGYVGRKQAAMPVAGVMQVPMGSRVALHASEANKELTRVQIGDADGRSSPLATLERDQLSPDRRGFSYPLGLVMKDRTLLFTLTDADGVEGREPMRLALVATPDEPPQLAVRLDGVGAAITARARLPVVGRLSDDYGIARVWFEHTTDQGRPASRPIAKLAPPATSYNLADVAFEVRDLGMRPGQKLFLAMKAADLCDLGRGPNVAASERWLLDVVTPEQLRAILEARELVLRQRFELMIQETTDIRDLLARLKLSPQEGAAAGSPGSAVKTPRENTAGQASSGTQTGKQGAGPHPTPLPKGEGTRGNAKLDDEDAVESPERQRELRFLRVEGALTNCRKGTQEILGLAEAFDDICKQIVNNRIDTEELKSRLRGGIADPLHALAAKQFPDLETRLAELQGTLEKTRGPAARDRAQRQADDVLLAMRKILDRMIEIEDFNEILEQMRNVVETQKRLHERTEQLHKQKIRDLLGDAKKAKPDAADKLSQQERKVAEQYKRLEEVLMRMAELNAVTDPRRAALLKKAIAQSKEAMIGLQFERLMDVLGKQQLSRALEGQTQLDADLRAMLELLMSENRAKSIANEKARLRAYLKELGALVRREKDLQGRTAGGDDPHRLAGEQAKVGEKTETLSKDIAANEEKKTDGGNKSSGGQKAAGGANKAEGGDSPEQNPARKRLDAARQRMREAESQLREAKRQGAAKKQDEAIQELERAKAELEKILRQLREEEVGRVLAMLEARFRKMLQMEEEVYEGTKRLDKTPAAERTHNHEIEASRLSGKQSRIVVEVDKASLILREEGSAVAFPEAIDQMRDDMTQVVDRLARSKVGKLTQGIEEDILAALREMIDSLKKAQKDQRAKPSQGGPMGGMMQEPPLVDGLAELRMIRALQMRVNTRTARYSKLIEGEQADNAELIEALRRLAERQQRIHRVTRDLQLGKNQ